MRLLRKIKELLVHYSWDLAYFEYNKDILTKGVNFNKMHIVKNPYKKKWFADPFILQNTNNELTLLVEEFDSKVKRGRIALVVIDKSKDAIVSCDIILDLQTHLSFPAIYRDGKRVLVHPENSASGASFMYEFDIKRKKLVDPIRVLDEPVTDAVIIKEAIGYKMFATHVPEPNGCELRVYVSEALTGPYRYEGIEEYANCLARMAGQFIINDNIVVRPAQDCEGAYGKAVVFFVGQNKIGEIRPSTYRYAGVHTFNKLDDICVIDIKRFDHPIFVKLKDMIKNWLSKLLSRYYSLIAFINTCRLLDL